MADPHPDTDTLKWAIGLVAAGASAAWGYIWTEIRSLRAAIQSRATEAQNAITAGDDKLWQHVTKEAENGQAFRERMLERIGQLPTKDDLRDLNRAIAELREQLTAAFPRNPHP